MQRKRQDQMEKEGKQNNETPSPKPTNQALT
jgi:hypothetical protein